MLGLIAAGAALFTLGFALGVMYVCISRPREITHDDMALLSSDLVEAYYDGRHPADHRKENYP